MSNYTKATNFASKDSLPTGDANKIVKGTEIDNEFNAISGAVSSKADIASPTFTGTPAAPTAVAGTNTTQVATTAFVIAERTNTSTLTNKTLTSPTITGGTITGITDLTVADGGTGVSTLAANNVLLGNGTSAIQTVAPSTSGNVLTSNGTTWVSLAPTGTAQVQNQIFVSGTATWTAPANVTMVKVTVYGGGGGGNWNYQSWGGNGGIMQAFVTVTPGTNYAITVGAGGNGGFSASAGGTSSFGSLVSATGGGGGPNSFDTVGSMGTGSTTGTALLGGNAGGGIAAGTNAGYSMRGPFAGTTRSGATNANEGGLAYSPTSDYGAGAGGWTSTGYASGGIGGVVLIEWVGV